MKCPECRHDNPDDARFCNGCGHKLELACPGCGKVNPAGSRFCNGCGQSLSAPEKAASIDVTLPRSYTSKHLAEKILTTRSSIEGSTFRKTTGTVYAACEIQAQAEANVIENEYELGKVDDAWNHIARFEEVTSHTDYDYVRCRWSTRLKDLKGSILLLKGEFDGVEWLARECLETATKSGWTKYIGRARRLSGRAFAARGAYDRAEEQLKTALAILEEVGNPKQLWITRASLASLYAKMGRPELEREQWQAAKGIVEATAAGLVDEQLRTTFLNAAPIREILHGART